MSTTNRTIPIFGPGGLEIGRMSPTMYQALLDILSNQEAPRPQSVYTGTIPCIECNHPRVVGIFCRCCFERLREHEASFAAMWYGLDWDEACQQAEGEVANG